MPRPSGMEVQPFALGPEDRDEFNGPGDRAEPVGRPRTEFDGFSWLDGEVLLIEQQPQAAVEHVQPVVLLATGMDYRWPGVPGIAERWGGSVFHCPFCHGWEVRDRPLGVLDRGASGARRALLLRVWSEDVTLLTNGPDELDAEDAERLRVTVDERRVAELRGPAGTLTAVAFADGGERPCGGLLVAVTLHQRTALAEQLGAAVAAPGPLVVDGLKVDPMFGTSVPGLFAAGDVSGQMQSVANAVAAGSSAAAMIVHVSMTEAHGLEPVG